MNPHSGQRSSPFLSRSSLKIPIELQATRPEPFADFSIRKKVTVLSDWCLGNPIQTCGHQQPTRHGNVAIHRDRSLPPFAFPASDPLNLHLTSLRQIRSTDVSLLFSKSVQLTSCFSSASTHQVRYGVLPVIVIYTAFLFFFQEPILKFHS